MEIKNIHTNYYEIETEIKEIIGGSSIADKLQGWPISTNLKLRCEGCTVMVFKETMKLFENASIGDTIRIFATEWKPNIFHFQKFVN